MSADEAAVAVTFILTAGVTATVIARSWIKAAMLKGNERANLAGGSSALDVRLARIEQAVDAIAVEVEPVSEGQRFTTRLLADRADPAPNERRTG